MGYGQTAEQRRDGWPVAVETTDGRAKNKRKKTDGQWTDDRTTDGRSDNRLSSAALRLFPGCVGREPRPSALSLLPSPPPRELIPSPRSSSLPGSITHVYTHALGPAVRTYESRAPSSANPYNTRTLPMHAVVCVSDLLTVWMPAINFIRRRDRRELRDLTA
ncbi:hypothetical protein BV898_07225 [Hypsibius exemplaris]|uniref:Uncharacterized protein n=1 Tax=Hypsibius exemplaris TaxID=2072580 RepID=A0A1W0WUA5_HYPEX|nr:hypothetical protein BV898_07225 [Hypsibius exemplaris]